MPHLLTSPAVQSSSETEINTLQTSVDGDINTCFTTATETDPWWIIDLGTEYLVSSIVLATSQDQTGGNAIRLFFFIILYIKGVIKYTYCIGTADVIYHIQFYYTELM